MTAPGVSAGRACHTCHRKVGLTASRCPRTVVWSSSRHPPRAHSKSDSVGERWPSTGLHRTIGQPQTKPDQKPAPGPTARVVRKSREQANVPAEQPTPFQEARLSSSHAHPRRSLDHVVASPQGPLQAVGLSPLLDQVHRMRSGEDFRVTVRRGARSVRPTLVTHVVLPADAGAEVSGATSVGFVVNRGVGSSVDRNRVKRRLRHVMRTRLQDLPVGSRIVIRALPSAKDATSSTLAADLDAALPLVGAR